MRTKRSVRIAGAAAIAVLAVAGVTMAAPPQQAQQHQEHHPQQAAGQQAAPDMAMCQQMMAGMTGMMDGMMGMMASPDPASITDPAVAEAKAEALEAMAGRMKAHLERLEGLAVAWRKRAAELR